MNAPQDRVDKPEPRWQALLAVLAIGPIYVALPPHLVMRGNLDFFLQRQSQEAAKEKVEERTETTRDLAGDFA